MGCAAQVFKCPMRHIGVKGTGPVERSKLLGAEKSADLYATVLKSWLQTSSLNQFCPPCKTATRDRSPAPDNLRITRGHREYSLECSRCTPSRRQFNGCHIETSQALFRCRPLENGTIGRTGTRRSWPRAQCRSVCHLLLRGGTFFRRAKDDTLRTRLSGISSDSQSPKSGEIAARFAVHTTSAGRGRNESLRDSPPQRDW